MAKNSQKENNLDLIENPDALADKLSKSEDFFKKNKDLLSYIAIGIVALFAGGMYYYSSIKENEQIAQEEMFQAVFYFEADSLKKALEGDGVNPGFETIIEDYDQFGLNKTANIAKFYAGVCKLKMGEYEDAIEYLKGFSASDFLLEARAKALIGDANMELEKYDEAITYYQKAVDYKQNKSFTPIYMMKLALAYETRKDYDNAAKVYGELIKEFPQSSEVSEAKKYKELAEGLSKK